MANYVIVDPIVGAPMPVSLTGTFATASAVYPPFPFGLQVRAVDRQTGTANVGAGVFQFVCGSSTASAVSSIGQFVQLRGVSAQVLLNAQSASKFPIGVAAGAISNTNVWGWVQVQGVADYVRAVASNITVDAGVALYASNAGGVQGGATAGNMILGLVCPVSNASGTANSDKHTYQLNYPQVVGLSAGL